MRKEHEIQEEIDRLMELLQDRHFLEQEDEIKTRIEMLEWVLTGG